MRGVGGLVMSWYNGSVDVRAARLSAIRRTAQRQVERQRVCGRLELFRNRQPRELLEVLERGVAPPAGLALLNREERIHFTIALVIDPAGDAVPRSLHRADRVDAGVIVAHEGLPQGSTGAKSFIPTHVMKPEQQRL